jgi:hypothetical protein
VVVLIADIKFCTRQLTNGQGELQLSEEEYAPRIVDKFAIDFLVETLAEVRETPTFYLEGGLRQGLLKSGLVDYF